MVSLLLEATNYVTTFNTDMIISLGLTMLTILLISRKPQDWKYIALPVTIMWHVVGIVPNFMQYLTTGFFWTFNVFKIEMLTAPLEMIKNAGEGINNAIKGKKETKQIKERTDKEYYSRLAEREARKKYYEDKNKREEEAVGLRIIRWTKTYTQWT